MGFWWLECNKTPMTFHEFLIDSWRDPYNGFLLSHIIYPYITGLYNVPSVLRIAHEIILPQLGILDPFHPFFTGRCKTKIARVSNQKKCECLWEYPHSTYHATNTYVYMIYINPDLPVPYIFGTKLSVANISGNKKLWFQNLEGNWGIRVLYKHLQYYIYIYNI